jgi:hypothetical protein
VSFFNAYGVYAGARRVLGHCCHPVSLSPASARIPRSSSALDVPGDQTCVSSLSVGDNAGRRREIWLCKVFLSTLLTLQLQIVLNECLYLASSCISFISSLS